VTSLVETKLVILNDSEGSRVATAKLILNDSERSVMLKARVLNISEGSFRI
jgi:hypothetical protein